MITDVVLVRLLQLVSPGLPIGMYSYSQGLETAIADGWIASAEGVKEWVSGIMLNSFPKVDLPLLARLYDAWYTDNMEKVVDWSRTLLAFRETSELRLEDRHSGQALARLLFSLGHEDLEPWIRSKETAFAGIFAHICVKWEIPKRQALLGYSWSWLENQVLCAVKLLPLGQAAGQRLLLDLADSLPQICETALNIDDESIGGSAFSLALASCRHEMQYSRLFRS